MNDQIAKETRVELFWNPDAGGHRGGAWVVTRWNGRTSERHVLKGVADTDVEGAKAAAVRALEPPERLADPLAALAASIDQIAKETR